VPRAATNAAILFLLVAALASHAGDILRGGAPMGATKSRTSTGSTAGSSTANALQTNARDRLARTTAALDSVKALQQAARNNANARVTIGGTKLPVVPDGLRPGGLQVDPRVPKNLNKPKAGDDASLWIGAKLPTQTSAGGGAKNVVIVQTDQQAILNWKTFNVGKKTTLTFDQSKGGSNASQWIAFNKVNDPKARPSQILGQIKAQGQVYILNQNGIIFGNNSQVNVHTLTASALPINDALISAGLLNNPTGKFLFDYQGSEDLLSRISAANPSMTFEGELDPATMPKIEVGLRVNAVLQDVVLVPNVDYTLKTGANHRTTLTLTAAGIEKAFPSSATTTTETFVASYGARTGDVVVEKGAQISSPVSAAKVGGRVALIGANVKNEGTISTPNGQTILAAGLQVGFQAHSADDASRRGLDTYIGAVADPTATNARLAGQATNAGLIEMPRGNLTIAGSRVRQNGFVDSSTSVELNGSVDLLADYDAVGNPVFKEGDATLGILFVSRSTGLVSLGKNSVMRIMPELDETKRQVGTSLRYRSAVNVSGKSIDLESDSILLAPNAEVAMNAGEWLYQQPANTSSAPSSQFVYTNGQIYADHGSLLDVSGSTDALAPLSENILTVALKGSELADSPLQRDGPFRATDANQVSITVDLRQSGTYNGRNWIGTPLADVSGFANLIQRSASELTKDGGSVTMNAGNSVVLQRDSTIDVSGGYLNYEGGFVKTSRLARGSQLIDIADATPDMVYDGLYTAKFTQSHDKWGVKKTYANPFFDLNGGHYEASYVSGGAGGSIAIKAPSMAVDGDLRGNTVAGPNQLRDASGHTDLPDSSKLRLAFTGDELIKVGGAILAQRFSPRPPTIVFDPTISQPAPAPFTADDFGNPAALDLPRRNKVVLSPDLVNYDGFSSLSIENDEGSVFVNSGADMTTQPGGSIDFQAARIDLRADLTAPGGDLNFTAYEMSPYEFERLQRYLGVDSGPDYQDTLILPGITKSSGRFYLRSGATLSTAGLISDERSFNNKPFDAPLQANAGSVTIAAYEANLAKGSVIDVSGGVRLDPNGKVSYGDAGSISVLAGKDPGERSADTGVFGKGTEVLSGGRLVLDSDLRGYSGATGGSLSIQAMRVRLTAQPDNSTATFDIGPDFFNQGGFASFSIAGIGSIPTRVDPFLSDDVPSSVSLREIPDYRFVSGLVIDSGLEINPQVQSWLAGPIGPDGDLNLETTLLPEGLRSPISLSFEAKGARDFLNVPRLVRGDLEVGEGARIDAGPGGSVALKGDTISLLGSVSAPGGSISVKGAGSYPLNTGTVATDARATVYIGPQSRLEAEGTTVYVPDTMGLGRRIGRVLPGGSISLAGNVIAEPGSVLNVSGASGTFDLSPTEVGLSPAGISVMSGLTQPLYSTETVKVQVDSDGGSISLDGSQMLFVESVLRGAAGGPTALGGSLEVSSGRFYHDGEVPLVTDIDLLVQQDGDFLAQRVPERPKKTDPTTAATTPTKPRKLGPIVDADLGVGSKVYRPDGSLVPARGYFSVDQFAEGGFDALKLGGNVRFSGPVTIDAAQALSVADGGILYADHDVTLRAPYVALGTPFTEPLRPEDTRLTDPLQANQPFYFHLIHGDGTLTVEASLIDIGNLAVRGVNETNLFADNGDIRGQGVLAVPGHLNIRAGQVYPVSGGKFVISAFDYRLPAPTDGKAPTTSQLRVHPGSITVQSSGTRDLPLSAGGELDLYASKIVQGGVLRAPLGTINLGWDGTGAALTSTLVGSQTNSSGVPRAASLPITKRLVLTAGSETSVSAVDADTGRALEIPYGLVTNSDSWVDPKGFDISVSGVPSKNIHLSAQHLNANGGSVIDLAGGGDLFAYRWKSGTGGTLDILASDTSFAVVPSYQADFIPFAPFSQVDAAQTAFDPTFDRLAGDQPVPGYANSNLRVGDRVRLGASTGLPAGDYTLLPARYALLPGAFLVTPQSGAAMGTVAMPDGSSVVSGYRYNDLNSTRQLADVSTRFEVAPAAVVQSRAEYEVFSANTFLRQKARAVGAQVPRLPRDAGHLVFQADETLKLNSTIRSVPAPNGIGASIDISTPQDILITDGLTNSAPKGTIVLSASRLSSFGAESLLIGGVRSDADDGSTTLTVQTHDITLDNSHDALAGPEIILASTNALTLDPGAVVAQTGKMVGDAQLINVSGDGLLLRVSSDPSAKIARTGLTGSQTPKMTIGAGASISGTSLTLDSSAATDLSAQANLQADYVALDSGQISLRLDGAGTVPGTTGLVLAGPALADLQGVKGLSLLSYSSIDIYGSGRFAIDGKLELHAGEIRGFDQLGGPAAFQAGSLVLDNQGHGTRPGLAAEAQGSVSFTADTVQLGRGRIDLDQFLSVAINAASGVTVTGRNRLNVQGDLTLNTPFMMGENSATSQISATGDLHVLNGMGSDAVPTSPGLGAALTLQGSSVDVSSDLLLPSGSITLHATEGDVKVESRLDVGGVAQANFDRVGYSSGGQINLDSDNGSVNVTKSATLSVAAQKEAGDAGTLSISTPHGSLNLDGTLAGQGSENGRSGSFLLDSQTSDGFRALNSKLDDSSFFERRSFRVREGDVTVAGTIAARRFDLSADSGSIDVTGKIDASGDTGGTIRLQSFGDLTLESGAELTVAGKDFDSAGKGGSILLEAGSESNGVAGPGTLSILGGSEIDLSVASANATSESLGQFEGILHLRAPRTAGNDIQVAAIDGAIRGASHIIVEGYKLYELTGTGTITTALRSQMDADSIAFLGAAGTASPTYAAMHDRLLANNLSLDSLLSIRPGIELINRNGDLTLGSQTSGANNDWNLQDARYGPKSVPGILTLRASDDLVFFNALQDNFDITNQALAYRASIIAANPDLPANAQSWSFRLTAGADLGAVDFSQIRPLSSLADKKGTLRLGKFVARGGTANTAGANGTTLSAITGSNSSITTIAATTPTRFQVIRTGSGDIEIAAGRDVQLLNQFATIYTTGTLINDPTMGGTFDVPNLSTQGVPSATGLGTPQEPFSPQYPVLAQYTIGGGNVSITAGNDIAHYLRTSSDVFSDDSSRQLPINWLNRRGYVDPATGQFGTSFRGETASTTWWVDFYNFFEGVGALGGGNVTLQAGRDVRNVDAVAPTNARMAKGTPSNDRMVELGGGDVTVRAGRDINGGVYYVERGTGTLDAGGSILTNATRSPSGTILTGEAPLAEQTWLPTTLFLGKGSFDVSARGDVLLGPVSNPFLLAGGINNGYWYKSTFSTYSPSTTVDVSSLGGSVTLRTETGVGSYTSAAEPLLFVWMRDVLLFGSPTSPSSVQPWLRLNETKVDPFRGVSSLWPATLQVSAPSGDINLVGDLTLTSAPKGTLNLNAGGSIDGLQISGYDKNFNLLTWTSSRITVSDANPAAMPQPDAPFSYQSLVSSIASLRSTGLDYLDFVDVQFEETGAVDTVLATKQALHSPGLHADDTEPVRLYAGDGDISGLTLFSPKRTRVLAGHDISDIALYIQNLDADDVTTVAAGRDITLYDANSPLRSAAFQNGNIIAGDSLAQAPQPGDIQLSGPGSLEVLAGRNLDLGTGVSNADGTAAGITTIGNRRNPFLPFDGADVQIAAGIGPAMSLVASALDFQGLIDSSLETPQGATYVAEALGLFEKTDSVALTTFAKTFDGLTPEQQAKALLDAFYFVLRGTARDRNDPNSPNYLNNAAYDPGYEAIAALFGNNHRWKGDIFAQGRDIRTRNGGDIDIVAPGGGLQLANVVIGDPAIPPGIITESGGGINIFTDQSIELGVGRIFTLRGGDMVIWSSNGDIAAGAASRTVASAPPTRVIIDPSSADVETDLSGLATGGGIGALATVEGVPPSNIDLIAPVGTVNAGDAGIRASGNITIAANAVANVTSISAGGTIAGPPPSAPTSAPNVAGLTAASNTAGANNAAANTLANQARQQPAADEAPSIISVDVLGYGDGKAPESGAETPSDAASAASPGGAAEVPAATQPGQSAQSAARSGIPSEAPVAKPKSKDSDDDDDDDDDDSGKSEGPAPQ
jgi:filamentous hemagglutinin family protein